MSYADAYKKAATEINAARRERMDARLVEGAIRCGARRIIRKKVDGKWCEAMTDGDGVSFWYLWTPFARALAREKGARP